MAWQDYTPVSGSGSASEIWMRRSWDYGSYFDSPIRISTNKYDSVTPSLAASGSYVYVAWEDYTPVSGSGSASEIWMRVSSNNGASFSSAIRITTNTGYSRNPSVAASGSYVYVAWQDSTPVAGSGGSWEIWMRVSSNNGASFGSPIRISINTGTSQEPSVASVGKYVYVAWDDDTPVAGSGTAFEIWMRASSNYGASFGSALRISTNTGNSLTPSAAVSGSYVYVAWDDDTSVSGSGTQPEIWLRVSSNGGASFGSAIRMSTNIYQSVRPSVAASGDIVCVAWDDFTPVPGGGPGANPEVWMRVSSNHGGTFGSATRITYNEGGSGFASVAVVDLVSYAYPYVAWMDDTAVSGSGGKLEIWFRAAYIGP